jgi:hypothetical protein
MKNKIYNLSLLFIVCIFTTGCPEPERQPEVDAVLSIINNSDIALYYGVDMGNYPDTNTFLVNRRFTGTAERDFFHIPSHDMIDEPGPWISEYERMSTSKFMYFLFDKAQVDTLPWDTIKLNYKILKRWDLSLEEIQALNWTLEYP